MAHAFRRFLVEQLDARTWRQADLAKASGLSRAHVSKLVKDTHEVLPQLPDIATVEALARAFNLDPARVMLVAIRATGVEDVPDQQFVYGVRDATNEELLAVLAERLRGGEGSGDTAPTSEDELARRRLSTQPPDGGSDRTPFEADLDAARGTGEITNQSEKPTSPVTGYDPDADDD